MVPRISRGITGQVPLECAACAQRIHSGVLLVTQSAFRAAIGIFLYFTAMIVHSHADQGRYLYIQANDVREGKNSVLGYHRNDDGTLSPLPGSPFYTGGTGMNNDTHGKLGPNDNDTPLVISQDGKYLFTVNTHSNTIAVFTLHDDGSLQHIKGSPFSS